MMSPLLRFWRNVREVKAPRHTRASRRPTKRFRPQLDPLEDRLAPATTLTWTGAVSQAANDPNNWAEGRIPFYEYPVHEYFDLIFPDTNPPNKVCVFAEYPYVPANSITFLGGGYTLIGGRMDLGKPGITSAAPSGTNTIDHTSIVLDGFEGNSETIPFDIHSNNILRMNGEIMNVRSGEPDDVRTREIRKIGAGTLSMRWINHFDSMVIEDGTVIAGINGALGEGRLNLLGGTLQSSRPMTLSNPIEVIGAFASISGTEDLAFSGRVQINPHRTLTIANTNGVIQFNNVLYEEGELIKTGAGTLTLAAINTYSGGTTLQEGTLFVQNSHSLGSGRLTLSGGTLQAAPQVTHGVTLPNPVAANTPFSRISGINSIDLNGDIFIQSGATLTVDTTPGGEFVPYWIFRGDISGAGSLIKTGDGHLDLMGNNSHTGGTEIREGSLRAGTDHALGGGLSKLSGGRLIVETGQTLDNSLEVSGNSSIDASSFIASPLPITFKGATTLLPGSTLTVNTSSVENEYAVAQPPELIFSGTIGGAGALTKTGDGRVTFTGGAANNYTGVTTVKDGTLFLQKPAGVNAIAGPLVIGDGVGPGRSAVVSLGAASQVVDTAPININVDGLFKKNNNSERINVLTGVGRVTGGDPPTLTVAFDDITATFEGEISGPGFVVKEGTGTWILTGANTYEGGTTVAGGTLVINGSVTSPVTVNAGATLGGTGTTGPVTLAPGAILSPGGADPAIQHVQDLVLNPEASYVVQLNGPDAGTGYDQLEVTGTVSLNGATLDASLGFYPDAGHAFVIVQNDGADPVSGTFAGLPQGSVMHIGGVAFHIRYDGGDGNDVALVSNTPPVITLPADQTAFQNVELVLGGLSVADPDDDNVTVTLRVDHGTLTLTPIAGLTVVGNGTSSVSVSGSQSSINSALAGLIYLPVHNYSGPDALMITASDGLDMMSASVEINVKSLAEQAADLRAQVQALWDAGVLNQGQANSLTVKLTLHNNNGDIGRVQAFLNEVAAFVSAGILSPEQGNPLLAAGNILLTGLRRR